MQFPAPIPVRQLAERFKAQIIGDAELEATGINEIHKVTPGDIAFSDVKKYFDKTLNSAATVPNNAIILCSMLSFIVR